MTLTELDVALETIARLGARRGYDTVDHQSIASHFEREVIRLEAENERLRAALTDIANETIIQGMSPALFARSVLNQQSASQEKP